MGESAIEKGCRNFVSALYRHLKKQNYSVLKDYHIYVWYGAKALTEIYDGLVWVPIITQGVPKTLGKLQK